MLSYFCSSPPINTKHRLEDEPTEKDAVELKPEPGRPAEDVLGFLSAQSSTLTKGNTSSEDHLLSSSGFSTLIYRLAIGRINKGYPVHGPDMAIVRVKEGSFQPQDLAFPKNDGREFRSEW